MQELKHNEMLKDYAGELDKLRQVVPNLNPVQVQVSEDLQRGLVHLKIGDGTLTLARDQALDLALELRKAANRIGTIRFEQAKKKKRRR